MSDLIRRSDAIEAIEGVDWYHQNSRNKDMVNGANSDEHQAWYKADDVYKALKEVPSADRPRGEWIPCSERLPKTDNTNEINEFNVLLVVRPKKHPEKTPQIYIGKLRPVKGDDGSGNFWGVKTAPCEWTIWGWSYFQEPEVLAWMPLPEPWKGADDE